MMKAREPVCVAEEDRLVVIKMLASAHSSSVWRQKTKASKTPWKLRDDAPEPDCWGRGRWGLGERLDSSGVRGTPTVL